MSAERPSGRPRVVEWLLGGRTADEARVVFEGLKARDPRVQAHAWRQVHPHLVRLCGSILRDDAWAEDMAQDIWFEFSYSQIDHIRDPQAMFPYIRLMAIRRARRQLGRRQRFRAEGEPPEVISDDFEPLLLESLEHEALVPRLTACLDTLRPRTRHMMRLRYHGERELHDIGAIFGVTKQAVSKTLKRALEALRTCIESTPWRRET